jgi:hypothetical protein
MTIDEVLVLVRQLPALDQIKLIELIAPEIEQALRHPQPAARKSLWGLCADLGSAPAETDINAARQEAWGSFPQEIA